MQDKKSFILYCDIITTIEKLSDEQAGQLFKIILQYVNDKNPEVRDLLLQIAFEPIRNQLKRDLIKWDEERHQRSEAGKKGMKERWKNKRKTKDNTVINPITNDNKNNTVINPITNITDTVNVTVTETVNDNVNEIENETLKTKFAEWIEFRKKKRKPIHEFARKKQINFLKSHSIQDACEIIDQSIMNDWQGLFELKTNYKKQKTYADIIREDELAKSEHSGQQSIS